MIGSIVEDRYLVEEELGIGAMGRVFAARHVKVGRRVAIKVMHDEHSKNPAIVERFAREAMVAARLRHPNLVSVLDVGQTPNHQPLLVLELAPGIPLSHMTCEALPGPRVINLIRQLLRGIAHAHAAGLIHRDLKPDNILVETTADGTEIPRIVDFGIAVTADRDDTVAGRRLTEANMVIGTPFYMSPEQARAKDIDARTDLFSLGVIMYELLAGMPPFSGTSVDVAIANTSKDAPTIASRTAQAGDGASVDVDPLLEAFMRKLMARRLELRFQSAREALDVLALIEIDRMAAARVLGGSPLVDVPRPMFAQGSGPNAMPVAPMSAAPALDHREAPPVEAAIARDPSGRPNSDEMTTITEATPDASHELEAELRSDSDFSDLDFDPARSMRRRKRVALGFVAAAIAACVAAFVVARPHYADAPAVDVSSQDVPDVTIRPVHASTAPTATMATKLVEHSVIEKRPVVRHDVRRSAQAVPSPALAVAASQPLVVAKTTPTIALASAPVVAAHVVAAPVVAVPVVAAPVVAPAVAAPQPVADSVDAVVAKYQSVAKKLKLQPSTPETDGLWMRFRLIRINESIATQQSRHQAFALLTAIDKAIEK